MRFEGEHKGVKKYNSILRKGRERKKMKGKDERLKEGVRDDQTTKPTEIRVMQNTTDNDRNNKQTRRKEKMKKRSQKGMKEYD